MKFIIRSKPLPISKEEQTQEQPQEHTADKLYLNTCFKCQYGIESGLGLTAKFSVPVLDFQSGNPITKTFEQLSITYTPTSTQSGQLKLNISIQIPAINTSFSANIIIPLKTTQLFKQIGTTPEAYLDLSITKGKLYPEDICSIEVWTGITPPTPPTPSTTPSFEAEPSLTPRRIYSIGEDSFIDIVLGILNDILKLFTIQRERRTWYPSSYP
jgi:hypothetical protein